MSNEQLYKVAYDEAVRALSEQQGAITTCALALLSFLGMATTSVAILWPRRWEGAANPREVIETYIESKEARSLEDLHRDLSLHMGRSYLVNQEGLERLALYLRIGSLLLTLEVFLWIVAIATEG